MDRQWSSAAPTMGSVGTTRHPAAARGPHPLSPSWSSPPVPLSTDVERGNEVGDWAPGSGASYWSPLSAYAERGTGGEDKGRGEGERSGRSAPGIQSQLLVPPLRVGGEGDRG